MHETNLVLKKAKTSRNYFRWLGTVVHSGLQMERYRQLARSKKFDTFMSSIFSSHSCTSFTTFKQNTVSKLRLAESEACAAIIAETFSGNGKYGSASITQTARAALLLLMSVIECIKEFTDLENQWMWLEIARLNKYGERITGKLATVGDRTVDCTPSS